MTPGNQANSVNNKLIKKVVPKPCFKNTANGGKRIFNIIVNRDIIVRFLIHPNIKVKAKDN